MFLGDKTDAQILSEFEVWVGKEREAITHELYYLREIEERKLYLLEASSLKDFCMKVHGYSRHEAQARIDVMRLMKVVPEIDADLDDGRLSLTVAAQAMSAFRIEDARRERAGEALLTEEEHKTVLADLIGSSTREADRKLATHFPNQAKPEQTKPVSEAVTRIEFNVNAELLKKLERLQTYYFHQTGGSWEKLFEILANHEIEKLDAPVRRSPGSKVQSPKVGRAPAAKQDRPPDAKQRRTRYVPKQIHQDVWSNWERGCDHVLQNGERCGSRRSLETDHIIEFAEGGTNDRENLRLVCGAHNRYRSDRFEKMRRGFMGQVEVTRKQFIDQLAAMDHLV
jgi:hypothetical protein